MPTIRQLPPSLVNKIAAGEVIERPASVVKELLENSVDAGATDIEISIESGGLDLIRISDNGCGIDADQVSLAVASHATSKLTTADDLFDVHTLGFRGEALASIAEISHLTLRTRTAESESGVELTVKGGVAEPLQPVGCPVGTTIEVRHLFFNTPVRRKFLRTPQTEAGHVTEAFTRIALAFPKVSMRLLSGSRTTFELPATDAWADRIRAFFGDEVADALIPVDSHHEQTRLTGFVTDPSVSRANVRMQYLFLNGRHIRDRSLQHALGEAYRGLLMVGRFPVCFLHLEMPAQLVDVNVHPTKLEVRFQEGGKVYSQLLQTLRHQFLTTDLTARVRTSHFGTPNNDSVVAPQPISGSRGDDRWNDYSARMNSLAPTTAPLEPSGPPRLNLSSLAAPEFRPFPETRSPLGIAISNFAAVNRSPSGMPTELPPGAELWSAPAANEASVSSEFESESPVEPAPTASIQHAHPQHQLPSSSHLGFQIHNRYLVTQDEHGMVLVDQHALHERILYEQLRKKTESRTLESQQLLVPEPLDLTPAEAAAALDSRELLAKIGIEIEPFGGDTILMTSYPAMLANMRPAEVLRQVLEPLMSGGKEPSARDLLDELLNMIACKAAIKAGDKLSPEEITSLLEQRYDYQDTHHCPHGRPTALYFSREQLDKMFKRT
ncbi:MAG: DNA mismatch repair endonuclease MutL [Pirellulaceae bacterium]|nr:DNA mismatch repair endonuclease MutL [Pirellulaceae bacterium]